jgi:hypothetical protein
MLREEPAAADIMTATRLAVMNSGHVADGQGRVRARAFSVVALDPGRQDPQVLEPPDDVFS